MAKRCKICGRTIGTVDEVLMRKAKSIEYADGMCFNCYKEQAAKSLRLGKYI